MWFWIILGVLVVLGIIGGSGAKTRRGNPVYCAKCNSRDLEIISEDDHQISYRCRKCGHVGAYILKR